MGKVTVDADDRSAIDLEKAQMLGIADVHGTVAGAAKAVVRQITKIEILEASDTADAERLLTERGALGTYRARYREAERVCGLVTDGEVPHGIAAEGSMWDQPDVRAPR